MFDLDLRGPFAALFIAGLIVGILGTTLVHACSYRYDVRVERKVSP